MKKAVYHILGAIVLIGSFYFVGEYLRQNWPSQIIFTSSLLVGAGVAYGLTHISTSFAWIMILRQMGQRPPVARAISAALVAQSAKYIPGNIAHHISRAALVSKLGITVKTSAYSSILEILSVSLAVLTIGLIAYGGLILQPFLSVSHSIIAISLALSVLAGVIFLKFRRFLFAIGLNICGLLLAGMSFALLIDHPVAIAAYAVAWLIGFLLPGAPAGLGAREAALVFLLGNAVDAPVLASAIVIHRVITALVDGVVAFAAYLVTFASIQRRAAKKSPTPGRCDNG